MKNITRTVYNTANRGQQNLDYHNQRIINHQESITFTRDGLLDFVNNAIANYTAVRAPPHPQQRPPPMRSVGTRRAETTESTVPTDAVRRRETPATYAGAARPADRHPQAANVGLHQRATGPTTTMSGHGQRPIPMPQTPSTNPDFRKLVRATYRHVQLNHAATNWENIPKGVERAIDKITASIKPPRPAETRLVESLRRAANDFKSSVVANVQKHLSMALQDSERELRELNQEDRSLAQNIVRRQIRRTLGRRLADLTLEEALDNATAVTTRSPRDDDEWSTVGRRGSVRPEAPAAAEQEMPMQSTGRFDVLRSMNDDDEGSFPPLGHQPCTPHRASRIRGRSSDDESPLNASKRPGVRSTPPGINTAAATASTTSSTATTSAVVHANQAADDDVTIIAETQSVMNDDDWVVGPTPPADTSDAGAGSKPSAAGRSHIAPPATPAPPTNPAAKQVPASDARPSRTRAASTRFRRLSLPTRSDGYVINSPDCWSRLPNLPTDVHTVVLADSNGRAWTSTPGGWATLSVGGARLEDVIRVLRPGSVVASHVKTIVVAVGVNNAADDSLSTLTGHVTSLHNVVAERQDFRVLFVETPHHPNATRKQTTGVDHLNKTARDIFGPSYVALPPDIIVTSRSAADNERVHYDTTTADKIIAQLRQVVDAQKN
jgi:hypothetical protein